MKITRHAQSCFLIEVNGDKVLIDPGTFVFNEESLKAEDFYDVDLIIATHDHSDHFDWENIKKIADNGPLKIFGTPAVIDIVKADSSDINCTIIDPNFAAEFDLFKIEGKRSQHGPLPNGKPAPEVCGVVVDDGKTRFYAPGDSKFLDQSAKADVIAVPICGQVVMNFEEAKKEILAAAPKIAVPIHYDSPKYPTNVDDFVTFMKDATIKVNTLAWGESIVL